MPSKCLVSANKNAYPHLFSVLKKNKHQLGVLSHWNALWWLKLFLFFFGSDQKCVLGKNKIKGCFVFFIHHKGRIIPLYQNRCRQTYMQKGGIKDCQNMHQSNILCNSNQSQFLEGRRQKQKERESTNQATSYFTSSRFYCRLSYIIAFCYLKVITSESQ